VVGTIESNDIFHVQFDARAYCFLKDYETKFIALEEDGSRGMVLSSDCDVKMACITPNTFATEMKELPEASFLLDERKAKEYSEETGSNYSMYFMPKNIWHKRKRQSSRNACVSFASIEGSEEFEFKRIVLQVFQPSTCSKPVLKAWLMEESINDFLNNRAVQQAKRGKMTDEELLVQTKRNMNKPSKINYGPTKIVPQRKSTMSCTNEECGFCIEEIPKIAKEKKIWQKTQNFRPRQLLFNPVSIAKNLELNHRLRTGLLEDFLPGIEETIEVCRNLSLLCFDVEAVTLRHREPTGNKVQKVSGSQKSGLTRIGAQIPVMIGVSYLIKGCRRKFEKENIGSLVFELDQSKGEVNSDKVSQMVRKWINFCLLFRARRESLKRKMLESYLNKLKPLARRMEELCSERYCAEEKVYSFTSTFLGKIEEQLENLIKSCYLVSFGGSRYDLSILDRFVYSECMNQKDRKIKIAKTGRTYKVFVINNIHHLDLRSLMGGGSLSKTCQVLGVDKKYGTKKYFQPFNLFTSLEVLNGSSLPGYEDKCFLALNGVDKICTEEEYNEYKSILKSNTHRQVLCSYLKQDLLVTLLCFLELQEAYRNLFGIEVLGSNSTTSSGLFFREATVIQPYLNFQPSFVNIPINSTIFYLTLNAISGGLVCKMGDKLELGDKLFPDPVTVSERKKSCKKILTMDFRSLYPSQMLNNSKNCIGEMVCYSPSVTSAINNLDSLFKLSSSGPVYNGEHYIMCCLKMAELALLGWRFKSVHHNSISGEISLIPRNYFDLVIFGHNERGKKSLFVYQYDGSVHAKSEFASQYSILHVPGCAKFNDGCNLLESDSYKKLLKHGEWQRDLLNRTYSGIYENIMYKRENPCVFHSSYFFQGQEYKNPTMAFKAAAALLPHFNFVSEPFPSKITPRQLLSKIRTAADKDPCYRSGLICLSGHFDQFLSKFYDHRFGLCIGKRKIRHEDLTEVFHTELKKRLLLDNPSLSTEKLKKLFEKTKNEFLKEEKLVASHSFQKKTISLAYWEFLSSVGFITTNVYHIVLYSLR